MEKVKVTLDNYDKNKPYQLFLRVNDENGITTGYTCTSYDEYTYDRKSPGPRPVKEITINGEDGKFKNYIEKGILSYDDFPEMKSSDVMWIAECGMVVIHIKNTEKDFIIYDLLHVSNRTFETIQQPSEQKEYDDVDASFRHYVIDVVNGKPQPLMISDTMFYLNADKVEVTYAKSKTRTHGPIGTTIPELPGYYDSPFMFDEEELKGTPEISAIYVYGGNNVTHADTIDGDAIAIKETTAAGEIKTETGYVKYTFSGTGAISLW